MGGNTLLKNDYIVQYSNYPESMLSTYGKKDRNEKEIITLQTGNFINFDMKNVLFYPGVTRTDISSRLIVEDEIKQLRIKIAKYEKEMVVMKKKLNNCVPMHTIGYLVVNSMVFIASLLLIILRYSKNLYTIDPYYLFCAVIISLGLFLTAITSIKDWKEYIIGGKEK